MNIINLRNVASQEIPSSYRGILRISPNLINETEEDDPTDILKTIGKNIDVSDSRGNLLPITFKPHSYKTILLDKSSKDLINIQHEYKKLFLVDSLNATNSIIIKTIDEYGNEFMPLNFVFNDGKNIQVLSYPKEAPYDTTYFNRNISGNSVKYNENIYGFDFLYDDDDDAVEDSYNKSNSSFKAFYENDKNNTQYIRLNGEILYHYIKDKDNKNIKLPIIKRRSYILGCPANHIYSYKKENENNYNIPDLPVLENKNIRHTQTTFLPLETIVYESLAGAVEGFFRSDKGRYSNLLPTDTEESTNNLLSTLFGETDIDQLRTKAPILATGVQSGTIHYNAIPPHHYFFHLKHRESGNSGKWTPDITTQTSANNIICQYVLCDGKRLSTIKNEEDSNHNQYKAIDVATLRKNWSNVHNAIAISTGGASSNEESSDAYFNTPRLFECNQYSLRFLRGLNWIRTYKITDINRRNERGEKYL